MTWYFTSLSHLYWCCPPAVKYKPRGLHIDKSKHNDAFYSECPAGIQGPRCVNKIMEKVDNILYKAFPQNSFSASIIVSAVAVI